MKGLKPDKQGHKPRAFKILKKTSYLYSNICSLVDYLSSKPKEPPIMLALRHCRDTDSVDGEINRVRRRNARLCHYDPTVLRLVQP
jgi:hypothetical protein